MAWGNGGKYDEDCEQTLRRHQAQMVVLLVFDGAKGHGFSVSSIDLSMLESLPDLLEEMAAKIRKDLQAKGNS